MSKPKHVHKFPIGTRVQWHKLRGTVTGHTPKKVRVLVDGDEVSTPLEPRMLSAVADAAE